MYVALLQHISKLYNSLLTSGFEQDMKKQSPEWKSNHNPHSTQTFHSWTHMYMSWKSFLHNFLQGWQVLAVNWPWTFTGGSVVLAGPLLLLDSIIVGLFCCSPSKCTHRVAWEYEAHTHYRYPSIICNWIVLQSNYRVTADAVPNISSLSWFQEEGWSCS